MIYEGKDQAGADETTPIPTSGLDSYTRTKALAEEAVLAASGQGGMLTAAIRPHGIFGPGVCVVVCVCVCVCVERERERVRVYERVRGHPPPWDLWPRGEREFCCMHMYMCV